MTTEEKAREFWLIPYYDEGFLCWDKSDFPSNETTTKAKDIDDIHVIEKQAYDTLKQDAEKLREALGEVYDSIDSCGMRDATESVIREWDEKYGGKNDLGW